MSCRLGVDLGGGAIDARAPVVTFYVPAGGRVSYFGAAAVAAARTALEAGGTTEDAALWARAAARGEERPPMQGGAP